MCKTQTKHGYICPTILLSLTVFAVVMIVYPTNWSVVNRWRPSTLTQTYRQKDRIISDFSMNIKPNSQHFIEMPMEYHVEPLLAALEQDKDDDIKYCPLETNITYLHEYYHDLTLKQTTRLNDLHDFVNVTKNSLWYKKNSKMSTKINKYLSRIKNTRLSTSCKYDCRFDGKVFGLGLMKTGTTSLNTFLQNSLCYNIRRVHDSLTQFHKPECGTQYKYLKHDSDVINWLFSKNKDIVYGADGIQQQMDFSNNFGDAPWLYLFVFQHIWYSSPSNNSIYNDNINLNKYCDNVVTLIDNYLNKTNTKNFQLEENCGYDLYHGYNIYDKLMDTIILLQNKYFESIHFGEYNDDDYSYKNYDDDKTSGYHKQHAKFILTLRKTVWHIVNSRLKFSLSKKEDIAFIVQSINNFEQWKSNLDDDMNVYEYANYYAMLYELHNIQTIYYFARQKKLDSLLILNIENNQINYKNETKQDVIAKFLQCKEKNSEKGKFKTKLEYPKSNAQSLPQLKNISKFLPINVSLNWRKFFNVTNAQFVNKTIGNDIKLDKTPVVRRSYYPLAKSWIQVIS